MVSLSRLSEYLCLSNTSQSLFRRIFRHFFDREIAMIYFSLKFGLPNVKTILLLFNILRNN
jgi:hypothetical protein